MKKFAVFLCSLFLVLFLASSSMALSYTIEDVVTFGANDVTGDQDAQLISYGGSYVNMLEGSGDYVHYQHNFVLTPEPQSIESASLTLSIRDDKDCWLEYALLLTEDGTFAQGEVDTAEYEIDIQGSTLSDGSYQIIIASICGDFFLDKSTLTMTYSDSAPVPEPATMLLFGCGLLGFAGVRRKK